MRAGSTSCARSSSAARSPPPPTRSPTRSRPSRRRSRRWRAKLGAPLIERDRRGVRPTAAGAALAAHAEGILGRMDDAEAEVAAIAGGRGGRLRIASFPTAGATLMPQAVASFRASHPGVEVSLAEGEPEEIAPRLRAGDFEIVLLFEFDGVGERLGAGHAPLRAARRPAPPRAARRAPLARRRKLRLEDLREEAWVQTSASSPCARHVVRSCHAAGFEPRVSFESDDYQTVQGLVAAGVGRGPDPPAGALDGPPGHPHPRPATRAVPCARSSPRRRAPPRSRRRWRRCSTCCGRSPAAPATRRPEPDRRAPGKREPPPGECGGGSRAGRDGRTREGARLCPRSRFPARCGHSVGVAQGGHVRRVHLVAVDGDVARLHVLLGHPQRHEDADDFQQDEGADRRRRRSPRARSAPAS